MKIKLILAGEEYVGKTTIINQFICRQFSKSHIATTGVEKDYKQLNINGKDILLEICDTPGKREYRIINKLFMKNSNIALLIYDITNRNTFLELNFWIDLIKNSNKEKVLFAIIGNKNDLIERQVVTTKEGKIFSEKNNCLFFELSSYNYEFVISIFETIIDFYLNQFKSEKCEFAISKYLKNELNIEKEIDNIDGIKEIKYQNGDEYKGYINNDKKEGKGIMKLSNGVEYDGIWNNDIFIYGKITYANQDIYEGEINNNKKEGKGTMIYENGNLYNGDWKKDLKEGNGILVTKNEDYYEGVFMNDYFMKGKIKYNNDDIYEGNYNNNKKNGKGVMKYKNGDIYYGCWHNDKKEGKGKIEFFNGNIFEGNWKNDIIEGYGEMKNKNGDLYEGKWENNELIEGTILYINGNIFEGQFKNNEIEKGKMILNNGDIY